MAVNEIDTAEVAVESAPPPPPPSKDKDDGVPTRFRSAADYATKSSLHAALTEHPYRHYEKPNEIKIGPCIMDANLSTGCCDWQTAKLDLSTSTPQSMEEEVKRLMELKEYAILDSEHEEKFERITALASRIFDVPICLVSLVDIGRQWFMSNLGLGEARETSREVSFCAHAILSKEDVFIVPDTLEDPRFVKNGLVTGAPFIRFYAGTPLVSPGGYKLGTFCIIDRKPRPEGLTLTEKQNLRELTEMAMDTMVQRKAEMARLMDEKTRVIACAAHDLLSPLTGIQLNLGLLMEDMTLREKLDDNQKELFEASANCSDMIERICMQAIESFRGELRRSHGDSNKENPDDEKGVVNVDQLIENIKRVVGTVPKKVPFFIEKDENVPKSIVSDDLKLFRSTLNYLTNACKHTKDGCIRLKIYVRKAGESVSNMELNVLPGALVAPKMDVLIMEVHDTGTGIKLEKYTTLFTPIASDSDSESEANNHSNMTNSGLGLYSVATEISSLGGEYGVFPRQDLVASHIDHDDNDGLDKTPGDDDPDMSGCVFWLSVPLVVSASSPASSPVAVAGKKAGKHGEGVKMNDTAKTTVADAAKLMPAPAGMPLKRSFNTAGQTNIHTSNVAKKPKPPAANQPLAKNNEDSSAKPQQQSNERQKRVLIIDDSLTIRKGLSRGFSRLGFEVDEAENGLLGFKKLKTGLYDLVLLDFLMPVMDGPDVARKFRAWEHAHRPDFHQYIVGVSAHANGKDAEVGIKAGMDRFMGKPVPLKSLKDLAQCKPVTESSTILDMKFKKSNDALEAATRLAEARRSDEDQSRSSAHSSVSSHSSTTFAKHSCLIVVQESEPTLQALQRIIQRNGWRAVTVKHGDGEDALRLLKLRNWDLVVIDNDLPIVSGTNCLVRFRDWEKRSRSVQQNNIFILSDTLNHHNLPTGFNGVLLKPVEPARLLQILDAAACSKDTNGSFKFPTPTIVR